MGLVLVDRSTRSVLVGDARGMILSVVYRTTRRLISARAVAVRHDATKDAELLVLRPFGTDRFENLARGLATTHFLGLGDTWGHHTITRRTINNEPKPLTENLPVGYTSA